MYLEPKGMMGGFYKITEWIMRISGSNLLWLICSSPFLFFPITWLFAPTADKEVLGSQTLFFMAILAPFTLFPATAALFSVTRKWVMGEGDVGVTKTYFKGYKENYKQSFLGGIFYTLLIVIMIIDYRVYMNQFKNLQLLGMIMLVFLIVLFVSLFNFFGLVAHYHLKVSILLKNSILLTIINPFRVLSTVLCTVLLGFLTYRFPWLILFGFVSLTAFVAFYNFYLGHNKLQEKVQKMREAEEQEAEASETENSDIVENSDMLETPKLDNK